MKLKDVAIGREFSIITQSRCYRIKNHEIESMDKHLPIFCVDDGTIMLLPHDYFVTLTYKDID